MRRTNYRPAEALIDAFFQEVEVNALNTLSPARFHTLYDRLIPVLWGSKDTDGAHTIQRRMRNLLVYLQRAKPQLGGKGATRLVREASGLALEKKRGNSMSKLANVVHPAAQFVLIRSFRAV